MRLRADLILVLDLKAAGIPFTTPSAVFKCAKRLNSGAAYRAATNYLLAYAALETWPQAIESTNFMARCMGRYARQIEAEGA